MEHLLTKKKFMKSFLSFAFVFALPLTVVILSLYGIGFHLFSQELKEKDLASIQASINDLTQEIDDCKIIGSQLLYKDQFRPFDLHQTPSEGIRLVEALNTYTLLNPFIEDIYVHFYNDKYFYTSTTSLDRTIALNHLSGYDMPNVLLSRLQTLETTRFLGEINLTDKEVVALAVPLKTFEGNIGAAVFLLNKDVFNDILYLQHTQSIYLLDKLFLEDQLSTLDLSHLLHFAPNYILDQLQGLSKDSPITYLSLNNSIVYGYDLSDTVDNLIILGTADYDAIYTPVNVLNTLMVLALILTGILTALCSYLVFTKDDTPFDLVETTLSSLTSLSSTLQKQVDDTIPLQRHFLLTKLISGQVNDWERFYKDATRLGLDFNASYYTIMMSFADIQHFHLDIPTLQAIETLQGVKIDSRYHLQHPHPGIDVFLLGTSKPFNLQKLQLPYIKLYFGTSHTAIKHLPKSYLHTHTLLDMDITQSKHLESLSDVLVTYKDYLHTLDECLNTRQFSNITRVLLIIIKEMESENLVFILRKSLCLEVILLFNNYFDSHTDLTYDKVDLLSLYKLNEYSSLKEVFIDITTEMLEILCTSNPLGHTHLSLAEIEAYIHSSLSRTTLSVASIAEHFETSSRHLSQFFHSAYETTIESYMLQLRMEKAKHLLQHTPYSVKVIHSLVGYSHISSFISDFKTYTDLTPGQYRRMQEKDVSLT